MRPHPAPGRRAALGLTLVGCALGWVSSPSDAFAQSKRYALILGNHHGEPEDVELKFAARDAQRMAQVMLKLGQVQPQRLHLLIDAGASQVTQVLSQLEAQIARDRAAHPDEEIMLLVYYSGHAGAQALHMSGTRLTFKELSRQLERSQAHLRVLIVDACRAGELTRVKGAKPAKPFKIEAFEDASSQGLAILTSTSADEDAQESDRIKGSYFTHHLLAGLSGAADQSGDQQVTLQEAYLYAYKETLRSTSRLPQVQHPTYAFMTRGRRELIMTRLDVATSSHGQLRLTQPGRYVIFAADERAELITEFSTTGPTQLSLKAGHYLVRWRQDARVHEAKARVLAGQPLTLPPSSFQGVPYAQVVRKGIAAELDGPARASLALHAMGGWAGALAPGTGAQAWAVVGGQRDGAWLSLALDLRWGQSQGRNAFLSMEQRALGARMSALKLWDLGSLSGAAGLGAGLDWVHQRFQTPGVAPARDAIVPHLSPLVQLQWAWSAQLSLRLEGALELQLSQRLQHSQPAVTWGVVPRAGVGLSLALF